MKAHTENPDVKIDKAKHTPCARCHEASPYPAQVAQAGGNQETLHRPALHECTCPINPWRFMKTSLSRRRILSRLGGAVAGGAGPAPGPERQSRVQKVCVSSRRAPKDYDPFKHKWVMALDHQQVHRLRFFAWKRAKGKPGPEGPNLLSNLDRALYR